MRLLFATVFAFAFVSSEAAALWGVEPIRMPAFLAAFGAVLLLALAREPRLRPSDHGTPALLALLLAAILAADAIAGEVDPIDYKPALIVPMLVLAPNLASVFRDHDPAQLVWRLLTVYVLATGFLAVAAVPEFLVRGRPDLARLDFTGSLVGHTGLCVVYLLATLARLGTTARPLGAALHLALAALAAVMVLLTGTRTALVTVAIYLALDLAAARERAGAVARLALALSVVVVTLALHTLLISDDFLERLLGGSSEDWTSGRASSQLHWLALALDEPLGLGFGAVRELLRDGRPALDGVRLLEWPHNEPLRFFVEAGLPGLAFVLLLLATLVRLALRAARAEGSPLRRALALAIAADMLAQSLFQNYFNSIYHATAMLLVLVTLAAAAEEAAEPSPADRGAGSRDDLPSAAASA